MEHQAAIETQAAERYTLAEMSEDEREAFEEHYFGCAICADDVRTLDALREGARNTIVVSDVPAAAKPRRTISPLVPWAAAASLLVAVGYQNLVSIPRLAARVAPAVRELPAQRVYLSGGTRAESPRQTLRANEEALLTLDVLHEPQFVSYRYELRGAKDEVIASGPLVQDVKEEPVSLLVRPLPAGEYAVVIEGVRKDGNRTRVTGHSLLVVQEGS